MNRNFRRVRVKIVYCAKFAKIAFVKDEIYRKFDFCNLFSESNCNYFPEIRLKLHCNILGIQISTYHLK